MITLIPESQLDCIFRRAGNTLGAVWRSWPLALQKPARVHQAADLSLGTELLQLSSHPLNVQQDACSASAAYATKNSKYTAIDFHQRYEKQQPADGWDSEWCGRVRSWLSRVRSNAANLGGMFTTAAEARAPFIDILSLFNSWVETSSLLTRGWAQNRSLLAQRRVSRWTRSCAYLVPDSRTTLACLIPLGTRSLMTSRMIKEPMKVYSADCQQRSAETSRKKNNILIFFSCIFYYIGYFCTYLSLYLYLGLHLRISLVLGPAEASGVGLQQVRCHSIHHLSNMGWIWTQSEAHHFANHWDIVITQDVFVMCQVQRLSPTIKFLSTNKILEKANWTSSFLGIVLVGKFKFVLELCSQDPSPHCVNHPICGQIAHSTIAC